MSEPFRAWIELPDSDLRSLLIALVGYEFGTEPEKRIPDIRESRKDFSNYIADQCHVSPSDVVLDLGSGCGFGTYWFAKRAGHVHACDISPAYLSFAKRECADLGNVSFHLIKSLSLDPISDRSIDVVCSMSVFIHLTLYDMYAYFSEFKRVVKPGGRVWFDIADPEMLDLTPPNWWGNVFLEHATQYRGDPRSLSGLMHWNSRTGVEKIAKYFGFESVGRPKNRHQLLFRRSA